MWHLFMSINAVQSTVHCWLKDYSWLSRVYVTVNAFRSLFPVKVLERECLTSVSSPLIDRTIATVAEMCFAKQLSDSLPRPTWILFYAWAAQLCCWAAILTKNNLFHVLEETWWFLIGYTYYLNTHREAARVIALVYVVYMVGVDIPTYVGRYLESPDFALSLDVDQCKLVDDWTGEYLWRVGYFVGATHVSMYLG